MGNLSLTTKIFTVVGFLCAACLFIAALSIQAARRHDTVLVDVVTAEDRALHAEKINGLIDAAVMDSRGIYMSRDKAEAEKFISPLTKTLEGLTHEIETWQTLLPSSQRADFARLAETAHSFVGFRLELIRLARDASPQEARAFGDNETNRANRLALNDAVVDWAARAVKDVDTIQTQAEGEGARDVWTTAVAASIATVVALILAVMVVRLAIVRPLNEMTEDMRSVAQGNLDIDISGASRGDEIGAMAKALEVFKKNALANRRLEKEKRAAEEQKLAAEDQKRAEETQRAARAVRIEKSISTFGDKVSAVVGDLGQAADQADRSGTVLAQSAAETTKRADSVAAAAEEATNNVNTVAAATEELTASIREISGQIAEANRTVATAVAQVDRTDTMMQNLAEAASRIGAVINLINEIAGQTNLLALNATIEAARAGEAGKGFAVVAAEVKALAVQTANATGEIGAQIDSIQNATRQSVEAIRGISQTITAVSQISTSVSSAVEEQSAATAEIARNVTEAAIGTAEVTRNIVSVSEVVKHSEIALGDLRSTAGTVRVNSHEVQRVVAEFLKEVRAE